MCDICSKCIGIDRCTKYCALQIGMNIVGFIRGIDFIETEIGDLKPEPKTGKMQYIVSGHIIEGGDVAHTTCLSDLSASIDASGKFTSFNGMAPQQILRAYLDTLSITQEFKDQSLKQFKKLNSNKLLPVPFKPGAECEIIYTNEEGIKTDISTRVSRVKWESDRKTGKINCIIVCEVDKGILDNRSRAIKTPIVEYGETIRLPQIERALKTSETDRELIKMSSVGFIKPIQVKDDKFTLAIDGSHLYRITDDRIFMIGKWGTNKLIDIQGNMEPILKSKAYKKIQNGLGYIEKHKRFIVPYGLFEPNKIQL